MISRMAVGRATDLLPWIASIGLAMVVGEVIAQEQATHGARFIRDSEDRVVSVEYFGAAGLRAAQLERFPHLQSVLIVYGTKLTADDIAYLSTLSSVSELSIGGDTIDPPVEVESDLKALGGMKGLEFVHLCKHDIQDSDLQFVADLPRLSHLEFNADDGLTGKFFVTDQCADYLAKAQALKVVDVRGGCRLTDQFVAKLTAGRPDLVSLRLGSPELTDESLRLLATRCKDVERLNMPSGRFTDRGVKHLVGAQKLRSVGLDSDFLTGRCVESIGQLSGLEDLSLPIRNISDEGARLLAGLANLRVLVLREPELTDAQFANFRGHGALEFAYLNGKSLSIGPTVETIATMDALRRLELEPFHGEPSELQAAVSRVLSTRQPRP